MGNYSKTEQRAKYYFIEQSTLFSSTRPDVYAPVDSVTLTPFWLKWSDSLNGSKNPGWRRAIAQHLSAGSDLTASRKRIRASSGRAWTRYVYKVQGPDATQTMEKELQGYFLSSAYNFPSAATIGNNEAYNKALTDFFPKAKDAMRSLSAGVSIGELGETVRMLRGGVRGISQGIYRHFDRITKYNRSIKRRKYTKRQLKHVASDWHRNALNSYLELQYGINPLIRDVNNAAVSASRIWNETEGKTIRVKSVGEQRQPSGNGSNNTVYLGAFPVFWRWQDYDICKCIIRGAVRTYSNVGLRNLATIGLLPSDFIPTMFDLIPGSFLLDYTTNVGSIVEAYSFPRHRLAWCMITYVTTRNRRFTDITCNPKYAYNQLQAWQRVSWDGSFSAPSLELDTTSVSRQNISADDLGIPSLSSFVPGLKNWRRYLNMAALTNAQKLAVRSNPLTGPKGLMFGIRP